MQSDWSTQPDSQVIVKWLPSNYNIFFSKSRLSKWIAIMNDDIGKFGYDSMQQRRKKYEKYLTENLSFKVKFLTCIVPNNIHEKIPVIGHLPPMPPVPRPLLSKRAQTKIIGHCLACLLVMQLKIKYCTQKLVNTRGNGCTFTSSIRGSGILCFIVCKKKLLETFSFLYFNFISTSLNLEGNFYNFYNEKHFT